MFGMGFTEILFIAVIAVIFLGPDKLPEAMVQIAKFFNSFKKTVTEAKSTFENEIHMNELREEALSYKRTLDSDISGFKNSLSNPIDDLNEALSELEENKSDKNEYKNSQQATQEPTSTTVDTEKKSPPEKKKKNKPKKTKREKKPKNTPEDDA
jgi:sec-independent protein translocase protein TatB